MMLACQLLARQRLAANLHIDLRRSFATAAGGEFVPPAARSNIEQRTRAVLLPPPTKTFYTGRSEFYDYVATLEKAVHHTRSRLTALHLMPLPDFARASLPPLAPVWKNKEKMAAAISAKLSASRHRRLIELLNELNDFRRIAQTAGLPELGEGIADVLELFERDDKEQHLLRGQRKPVTIDEHGRSYALGRRKTSSARVWMISSEHATQAQAKELDSTKPLPTTQILVNNVPLNEYFVAPVDRERILRPFRLAGLLGAYNVFALVRGGGTSGQSGAVAHGIAKGLAAYVPDVETILRKSKLLRRDPRMVERKKTGLAKARKRYAWVKR